MKIRKQQIARRDFLKGAAYTAGSFLIPIGTGILPDLAEAAPVAPPPGNNFYMVSFGDSVMWGQGLPEAQKYRTLVKNWLAAQFQGQRNVVELTTHSHSGAVTGFSKWPNGVNEDPDIYYQNKQKFPGYPYPGEVPFSYPSISHQASMTLQDLQPMGLTRNDVGLVLINGGINDFGVLNVLTTDPTVGILDGSGWVRKNTQNITVAHMTTLLPAVLNSFPTAKVVITGYYPIVSHASDLDMVVALLTALGGPVGLIASPALKNRLVNQSRAFNDEAFTGLTNLVNQTNRSLGTPRVALAWPNFQPQNSYAGSDSYLFHLGQFISDEDRGGRRAAPPGDWATAQGVAYYRAQECASYFSTSPKCYDACMGHPNAKGAQAFANAVIALLPGLGVIPHAATAITTPPKTMTLSVQQGSQGTRYWVTITATDSVTHAPVQGTVSINGVTGATGTKISFAKCSQSHVEGVGGSKEKVTEEVVCPGTVTAAGYNLAHFSAGGAGR